ncbi:MAG: metal-sensing transcriptional repressor [Patescibacteria group bacterium]
MLDKETRRLTARLHRIEGQLRALEKQLVSESDPLLVIAQFDAAISATKGALNSYINETITDLPADIRQKIIKRVITKS